MEPALRSAQSTGVRLLSHNVVYHLMDALRAEVQRVAVEGAAAAAAEDTAAAGAGALTEAGTAEVVSTFPLSSGKKGIKDGRIAGGWSLRRWHTASLPLRTALYPCLPTGESSAFKTYFIN